VALPVLALNSSYRTPVNFHTVSLLPLLLGVLGLPEVLALEPLLPELLPELPPPLLLVNEVKALVKFAPIVSNLLVILVVALVISPVSANFVTNAALYLSEISFHYVPYKSVIAVLNIFQSALSPYTAYAIV